MNRNKILTLFDQSRRNPGETWEVTEHIVRQQGTDGGEGNVYYSCFPPEKLDEGIKEQIAHFSDLGQDFDWTYNR